MAVRQLSSLTRKAGNLVSNPLWSEGEMTGPVLYHLGKFPPADISWTLLVRLIADATRELARYDALLGEIKNARVLLSPLLTQEAVLSSMIEGTTATMGEVLEFEAGGKENKSDRPKLADIEEIINYRTSLTFAVRSLKDRPLSWHLMRETHALLMQGVRGKDKYPGEFRKKQNWIGQYGADIEQASFVPIPQEHLQSGRDKWEGFVNDRDFPDPLVQLAILHLEFEALHPFNDGNGRMGRIIIPLFLKERDLLCKPYFYMSGYLESNRSDYIEAMRAVSRDGDWTPWCSFFLEGLKQQASENCRKAKAILDLHQTTLDVIEGITRHQNASSVVGFIFSMPIFTRKDFEEVTSMKKSTSYRILRHCLEKNILSELDTGSGRRGRRYTFPDLLNIAEGRKVFS